MGRAVRVAFVLLFISSLLVVVPGDSAATVPGDVGRIVFLSNRDHVASELYVRDFAGSSATRITFNAEEEAGPKWSPDGTLIGFSHIMGDSDVHVINPDGSNEINLTNDVFYDDFMQDWSPDGTRILFRSDRGGNSDLWTMYPDGSDPQQLTNTADAEYGAVWSPDGSTIAYCVQTTSTYIWLMNADGSNARRLDATQDGCEPTWSPDGTQIAYDSHASGSMDIWIIDADGTNPVNVTNDPAEYYHIPAWSPDGQWIAFERLTSDWELMMIHPDGSGLDILANSPTTLEFEVDWESVNRPPVVVGDEAIVHRGQSVEIAPLANDSDPDGESIELGDITRMPGEGTVAIGAGGLVTYTHDGRTVPRDHPMPYIDSFDYRVDDERLGSSVGTVQVWIYPYFDDVPQSNVFFEDVLWLAVEGITFGCNPPENTMFCPTDPVTRGQMAAFLVRALSLTDDGDGDLFVDDNGSIFEGDIDKLGTAGVTRGCNPPQNNRFCPDDHVTRGQMAAFLARAYGLSSGGSTNLFIDDDGLVFEGDIDKLGASGVSRGCNPPVNDRFCPDELVTREQMAAFLRRAGGTTEE